MIINLLEAEFRRKGHKIQEIPPLLGFKKSSWYNYKERMPESIEIYLKTVYFIISTFGFETFEKIKDREVNV